MNSRKKIFIFILAIEIIVIVGFIIFLFYMNSDTVKANRQLELAQHYLLEEDYEQAIVAYEIVIQIDPKNTEAYLGLTQAYTESYRSHRRRLSEYRSSRIARGERSI